jgi:hypothetical protein
MKSSRSDSHLTLGNLNVGLIDSTFSWVYKDYRHALHFKTSNVH